MTVKSRVIELPIPEWVEEFPDPEHKEWAKTQCKSAASFIVSLFSHGKGTDGDEDEGDKEG